MNTTDRTWAEIHLSRIENNHTYLQTLLPQGCRILAPVKADAYGHGAVAVSRLLADLGCSYLAVASLAEAMELRQAEIRLPILIFGYTDPKYTALLADHALTQSVFAPETAQAYSAALAGTGKTLSVHIKLDTGMGRLGFPCLSEPAQALPVGVLPGLELEGVFTHFSVSDTADTAYTRLQLQRFQRGADFLEAAWGRRFALRHSSNSGGVLAFPQAHMDLVRPGIALYGLSPNPEHLEPGLEPAMELKTRVIQVRPFAEGESVSYGRTYRAAAGQTLAVLPVGYADGLPRRLSGKMEMLLHGRRVPQVGRICMDLCMVDVSGVKKVSVGDVVTVFGRDGEEALSIGEHSSLADTISYELLCSISPRVPRLYLSR